MNLIKRRPTTAYFALAFLFSWLLAFLMLARYNGQLDLPAWLHYLVAWGPAAAAVVVTGLSGGRAGLGDLARRLTRWQIGWTNALLAVGSPLLLLALAVLVSWAVGGQMPDLTQLGVVDYLGQPGILAALLVWIFSFGLGEEIGWRGFAQHHLEPERGFLLTTLLIGVIWAFWHIPFFFYKDTFMAMGLVGFPLFVVTILPGAIVLGWLYSRTHSLLAVGLWHGLFDFATASAVDGGTVSMVVSMGVMVWAALIVIGRLRAASSPVARREPAAQR
ncbi:MAG: CPBP family intramembrane metalloprotease [Chloroflexi bacterium]|nr:CPBP family intramembrane metalloprotease [Chloroflexota bacterium]